MAFAAVVVAPGVYGIHGRGWWVQFCPNEWVYILGPSEGYYWWVRDGVVTWFKDHEICKLGHI